MSGKPLQLRFVMSAASVGQLPASDTEIAIVGRSNVGKSSLINALANQRQLAQVSSTPGRTRLLNLFELGTGGTVVDLPGYGYAAVSKTEKAAWQPRIEGYLLGRESLVCLLLLVDAKIGPTKIDLAMLAWLRANELPFGVVATKLDKVGPSKRGARKPELARACGGSVDDIAWVSASKGIGIEDLRAQIRHLLGHDHKEADMMGR